MIVVVQSNIAHSGEASIPSWHECSSVVCWQIANDLKN
jgi:hypothetical protein